MPISLSEFLNPRKPGDEKPAQDSTSSPQAPAPRGPSDAPGSVRELKTLLGELTSEWKGIVEAIGDLKKELAAEEGIALGPPDPGTIAPSGSSAPLPPKAHRQAHLPAASVPGAVASSRRDTEKVRKPPEKPVPAAPPSAQGTSQAVSPELERKLGELLKLLKESAASRAGGTAVQAIEIPKNLTLEIAREVAGRVRETMMESFQGPMSSAPGATGGEKAPSAAKSGPKRIPMDDLNAIINQITGQGSQGE